MKTLALGAIFQRRFVCCSDLCARRRSTTWIGQPSSRQGSWVVRLVLLIGNYKMFDFRPLRRHIDASLKHTYTGKEALP